MCAYLGMKIFIEKQTGKFITLEVDALDTIANAKFKIQSKAGIPHDQQKLEFKTTELDDSCRLSDCKIQNKSTLQLYTGQFYTGKDKQ